MKTSDCWRLGWLGVAAVWPLLAVGEVVYQPLPEDMPKPVAGGQTLAGDPRPDIVRFLKVRWAAQPDISPDGKQVSYLTSTTGQPQLWVADVEGGEARQLTFLESIVTFQSWSPAGNWIAYGTDLEGNEREGFYLISPDGFEERAILPPSDSFRVWGGWSPDGRRVAFASTERNGLDFDIYTVEVGEDGSTSEPVMIHEGKGGLYVMGWSKDGKSIVLTQARGEADNDLYLLDVESRKLTTLFRPSDGANYEGVSWTEDGFYVATNQDRDLAALAFYNVETRELLWKETPNREVERPALSGDGKYLAWTVNEDGYSGLRAEDLETGKPLEIAGLPRGTYTIRWARERPVLMIKVASPRVPGDVWVYEPGRTARRVTRSATAGLRPERFVEPEPVSFVSWDGERIHGLLYLPTGEGAEKRPVLIHVHGGPTAQSRPSFSPDLQFFLPRGVAILDLNYRGSTGYGKRYTRLDNQRLRMNGVKDVGAAVDWLKGRSDVDGSRVAIMGGSYGGFLTCAAVTEFPDKFRAGINIVGVCNWIRALEEASPQLKASDVIEYGDISDPDDRAYFESISPIRKADRITAAMMVLHGANDPRVPVGEADELVATIRKAGGEAQYLRFPDEGHGFRKLSNQIIAYRRIAEFLEEKLLK